jgi:hypothetical protein
MDPEGIWGIEIFVRRSGSSGRVDGEMAISSTLSPKRKKIGTTPRLATILL